MRCYRLVIAAPPSANKSYMNRRYGSGRMKTPEYKRWRDAMAQQIRDEIGTPFPPRQPISVTIFAAVSRQRDMDNLIKPMGDALKQSGMISDDRWIDHAAVWRTTKDQMPQDVALVQIEDLDPQKTADALREAHKALGAHE